MTLAKHAYEEFKKRNITSVMWGDGVMVDIANEIGIKLTNSHPLNMMTRLCSIMRKSPSLFEHYYVKGHDSRGRIRNVNGYKVK